MILFRPEAGDSRCPIGQCPSAASLSLSESSFPPNLFVECVDDFRHFGACGGTPRGVVAQVLGLAEERLSLFVRGLPHSQLPKDAERGLHHRAIGGECFLWQTDHRLDLGQLFQPLPDKPRILVLQESVREYDRKTATRLQELEAPLQAQDLEGERLSLVAELEAANHLLYFLAQDAAERRIRYDKIKDGRVANTVVPKRQNVRVVLETQKRVEIADVRVAVIMEQHVGHRNANHAVGLLDAVQMEELELVQVVGVKLLALIGDDIVQAACQEVAGAAEWVQDQVRSLRLHDPDGHLDNGVRGEVLSHPCPNGRPQHLLEGPAFDVGLTVDKRELLDLLDDPVEGNVT